MAGGEVISAALGGHYRHPHLILGHNTELTQSVTSSWHLLVCKYAKPSSLSVGINIIGCIFSIKETILKWCLLVELLYGSISLQLLKYIHIYSTWYDEVQEVFSIMNVFWISLQVVWSLSVWAVIHDEDVLVWNISEMKLTSILVTLGQPSSGFDSEHQSVNFVLSLDI